MTNSGNVPLIADERLPGQWNDITDESRHDHHWHRNGDYPSIRIMTGWTYTPARVEMYPNPEGEDVLVSTHDDLHEAASRVLELMEEYPRDE